LENPARKTEAQFINEEAGGVIGAEGKNPVFIKNDAETAVSRTPVMHKRAELILEYGLAAVSCNHIHPSFIIFSFTNI
jgi:hypothetical protein